MGTLDVARPANASPQGHAAAKPATPTVLVADDDPDVLALLDFMLSKNGFQVILARDGGEAVDQFRTHAVDLVVTDLAMPKLNGLQVARIVKRAKPALPILMITAWGLLVSAEEQRESGIDAILNKPTQMAEIVTALRTLWETGSGGEAKTGTDLE